MDNNPAIKAYSRISKNYQKDYNNTIGLLNDLKKISSKINSKLINNIKPVIILSLKWKFDYLTKTLQSPFLIILTFNIGLIH